MEGNTLTYGQTELLLLFGKVSGEADLKDFNDMKASEVSVKMMTEDALSHNTPLTQNFIRTLHHTLLREDYTEYRTLPNGVQTSYVIHTSTMSHIGTTWIRVKYFTLRFYALHDCRITRYVG